jgi:DNA-3-methyladenine glycosylase II
MNYPTEKEMTQIRAQLAEQDPLLADATHTVVLPSLDISNDIYISLLDSVVSQQLSTKVATIIFDRLLLLFEGDPSPKRLLDTDISNQKAQYLKNIAAYWIDQNAAAENWEAMPESEIIERLTTIKGVGEWTVQMILMFQLGRLDVFPVADLGILQGMERLYTQHNWLEMTKKQRAATMQQIAETWKPYRTVGSRLIWRWKDSLAK